jgi:hypothetical protein
MAYRYYTTAIERVLLMQRACIQRPDGGAPDAFSRALVVSQNVPYWTNVPARVTAESTGTRTARRVYHHVMRLVIGIMTADYTGANDDRLAQWMEETLDYFNARPTLKRTAADEPVGHLDMSEGGASISDASGYRVLTIGPLQQQSRQLIVCDFTLVLPFIVNVTPIL